MDLTVRRDCIFDLSDEDGSDADGRRVRRRVSPSSGGGGGDDDNSVFVSDDDDFYPTPGECECDWLFVYSLFIMHISWIQNSEKIFYRLHAAVSVHQGRLAQF